MSKKRLSEVDTERLGLLKKGKTRWEFTTLTPSWVHKYLLHHGITRMERNPLTSLQFADWIRNSYPEEAVLFGLADLVTFTRLAGSAPTYRDIGRTDVQYSDRNGLAWIKITHPKCPAGLIEYATTKYPQCIDDTRGLVSSDLFMTGEFASWVCRRDQDLACMLGLGVRQAVRLADEAEA